jgi:hypothetical protein
MRPRNLGDVDKDEEEAEYSRTGISRTDSFGDESLWSSQMVLRVVKGLFVSAGRPVGQDVDRELEDLFGLTYSSENKEPGAKEVKGWRGVREVGMYI